MKPYTGIILDYGYISVEKRTKVFNKIAIKNPFCIKYEFQENNIFVAFYSEALEVAKLRKKYIEGYRSICILPNKSTRQRTSMTLKVKDAFIEQKIAPNTNYKLKYMFIKFKNFYTAAKALKLYDNNDIKAEFANKLEVKNSVEIPTFKFSKFLKDI